MILIHKVLLFILVSFVPFIMKDANAQDPIPTLINRSAPSIVKIVGNGTSERGGREVAIDGTGFVIASHQHFSVILTAAHVIKEKAFWRRRENGEPDRRLEVWVKRSSSELAPLPLAPTVAFQSDEHDYAILLVNGVLPALQAGDALTFSRGAQVLTLGYSNGEYVLSIDVGRAKLDSRPDYPFVLDVSDMKPESGWSGGPVLDLEGRVLGVFSGSLRERLGLDLAVPINTIRPTLAPYKQEQEGHGLSNGSAGDGVTVDGSIRLEMSGTGGGDFGRVIRAEARLEPQGAITALPVKVGDDVSIAARGGERSECKEESGRTVSIGQASASVLRGAENSLVVNVDLYVHGGHYRTAASCVVGQLVGITGHDTSVQATGVVQGSIRMPVLDDSIRALKLQFEGLPQSDYHLEIVDPDGVTVTKIQNQAAGSQEIVTSKKGIYIARLSMFPRVEARGSSGEQRIRLSSIMRLVPMKQ